MSDNKNIIINYKNVVAVVPSDKNILLVLGAFRHAVGNTVLPDDNSVFIHLLRNHIPEENFFFNIPFTNSYINNKYAVFNYDTTYQCLCKVDNIEINLQQYKPEDTFTSKMGTYDIVKVYKISKYNIKVPSLFAEEEIANYYKNLDFVVTKYGEIPILEKEYTMIKDLGHKDGVYKRLYVPPEHTNIIINRIQVDSVSTDVVNASNLMLTNYAFVFKYTIVSRIDPESVLTGYLLFRDSVCYKDLIHLETSGFNCNLCNVDIIYMLASIIIPGRSVEKPYLRIMKDGTMLWVAEETDAYIPPVKLALNNIDVDDAMNALIPEQEPKEEKGFWTKNRSIF